MTENLIKKKKKKFVFVWRRRKFFFLIIRGIGRRSINWLFVFSNKNTLKDRQKNFIFLHLAIFHGICNKFVSTVKFRQWNTFMPIMFLGNKKPNTYIFKKKTQKKTTSLSHIKLGLVYYQEPPPSQKESYQIPQWGQIQVYSLPNDISSSSSQINFKKFKFFLCL